MSYFLEALLHGLVIGAIYAIVTFGLAVVHSVSGILNFAHGNFVILAAYLALWTNSVTGWDPYLTALVVIPVLYLVGVTLYRVIFRRLSGAPILSVVQLTLGIVFVVQSVLLIVAGGNFRSAPSITDGMQLTIAGARLQLHDVVSFLVSVVLAAVLFWSLDRTSAGRTVRAVYQNGRAAQLVGVDVEKVRLRIFGLGLALTGVAALLYLPGSAVHPSQGLNFTVIAITAFFIGGMGSIAGSFFGAIALGIAESLGSVYLPGSLGFTVPYLVVIGVILVRGRNRTRSAAA